MVIIGEEPRIAAGKQSSKFILNPREWVQLLVIIEDGLNFLERNTVRDKLAFGFRQRPFKFHALSFPDGLPFRCWLHCDNGGGFFFFRPACFALCNKGKV